MGKVERCFFPEDSIHFSATFLLEFVMNWMLNDIICLIAKSFRVFSFKRILELISKPAVECHFGKRSPFRVRYFNAVSVHSWSRKHFPICRGLSEILTRHNKLYS